MAEAEIERTHTGSSWFRRMTEVAVSIAAFCIAIGELDGTVQSVNQYYESFVSKFTDTHDYEKIDKINVGNTLYYLETLYGKPMVSKDVEAEGKVFNVYYYYTGKYLISVFLSNKIIAAYTVLNFKGDFNPIVNSIEKKKLGQFSFEEASGIVDYVLESGAAMNSYVELHEYGRRGFFRRYYYGYIDYAVDTFQYENKDALLSEVAELEVMGDEAFENKFNELRRIFRPNFYGEGELSLLTIRKSLMSKLEFESYFSREEK